MKNNIYKDGNIIVAIRNSTERSLYEHVRYSVILDIVISANNRRWHILYDPVEEHMGECVKDINK